MKRDATHAGSWYSANKTKLNAELDSYLEKARKENTTPLQDVKAIIAPHAGFAYSGPTAAFAYQSVDTTNIKRVFLLGPSHHIYLDGCALSKCDTYETPLGDIPLDKEMIEELAKTGKFGWMKKSVDEDEHSLEMHLPFTYKIFENKMDEVKLVPILVGSISSQKETMYGELLSPYLDQPENLFIISSDFCHWGHRFGYVYYTAKDGGNPVQLGASTRLVRPIHESIQSLDFEGIETLEELSFSNFQAYLERTDNTICGRHPIAILLAALEKKQNVIMKCVEYAQSSPCINFSDSSVSYASLYVQIKQK